VSWATRRSYDVVAARYAAEIGDELAGKPLDRALLDAFGELSAGGAVLDVGCGPGHVTAYLARQGSAAVGFDVSPAMCGVGRDATGLAFAAADMTSLPARSGALGGIVCLYALIHLDARGRSMAYAEFARTLRPGGVVLVGFHRREPDVACGGDIGLRQWWGHEVDLTFRFLDPAQETAAMGGAGLAVMARLDREAHPDVEHPSRRSYLVARREP
jgi:SAM-dependent methyltransferase